MAEITPDVAVAREEGWAVLLDVDGIGAYAYGPFDDDEAGKELTARFRAFLTAEVDPARIVPLSEVGPARPGIAWRSPLVELLDWRESVIDERHDRLTEVEQTVDRMVAAGHISPVAAAEVRFAAGVITRTQMNAAIEAAARGEGR